MKRIIFAALLTGMFCSVISMFGPNIGIGGIVIIGLLSSVIAQVVIDE